MKLWRVRLICLKLLAHLKPGKAFVVNVISNFKNILVWMNFFHTYNYVYAISRHTQLPLVTWCHWWHNAISGLVKLKYFSLRWYTLWSYRQNVPQCLKCHNVSNVLMLSYVLALVDCICRSARAKTVLVHTPYHTPYSFPPCFLRSTQLSTAQSQVLTTKHNGNFSSSSSEVCVGAVTGDNWHPSDNSSMTVTCVAVTYMRHVTCILSYLHDTYTHLDKVGCFVRIPFIDYSSAFNTIAASFASRKAN